MTCTHECTHKIRTENTINLLSWDHKETKCANNKLVVVIWFPQNTSEFKETEWRNKTIKLAGVQKWGNPQDTKKWTIKERKLEHFIKCVKRNLLTKVLLNHTENISFSITQTWVKWNEVFPTSYYLREKTKSKSLKHYFFLILIFLFWIKFK